MRSMNNALVWTSLVGVLLASPASWVTAQCVGSESAKLMASDGTTGDWFGAAVALSGDVALIGAYADSPYGQNSGSAYIYRFDGTTWQEEKKLVANDGVQGDNFGSAVAIDGNFAVVGAVGHDVGSEFDAGQVYVYRFDGSQWKLHAKLTASDGKTFDAFGSSVTISGTQMAVGAWGDDVSGATDAGSAYVFQFTGAGWIEVQKVTASDGAAGDRFSQVSVENNILAVGAPYADTAAGKDAGAAYVFRFNGTTWVEEQKLTASDGASRDRFGWSVATDGAAVVVGSPASKLIGAAYVYRFDGSVWNEEQKLLGDDSTVGDALGNSVTMFDSKIVAGAPGWSLGSYPWTGIAYAFGFDGRSWTQVMRIQASDAFSSDQLGMAVSGSGQRVLIGAWLADSPTAGDAGAAYVATVTDLALSPSSASVSPGDTLSLATCGGLATWPSALFLIDVNGTPLVQPLGFALFDAQGTWTKSGTVPPGLSGLVAGFQSWGFVQPGVIGASGVATVVFL